MTQLTSQFGGYKICVVFSNLALTFFSTFSLHYSCQYELYNLCYVISGNIVIYWHHQSMKWLSMVHLLQFPQLHKLTEIVVGQLSSFTLSVSSSSYNVWSLDDFTLLCFLHLFITGFLLGHIQWTKVIPLNIRAFIEDVWRLGKDKETSMQM